MYITTFEFETIEDTNVLITLVEETKLTPVLKDLRVEIYSYKENEAEFVKDSFNVLLERRNIIFESWQGRTIDNLVERVKQKLDKRYNL